jgi:hypothetical protein
MYPILPAHGIRPDVAAFVLKRYAGAKNMMLVEIVV